MPSSFCVLFVWNEEDGFWGREGEKILFCQGRVDLLTLQMRQIGAANQLAGLAALGLPALNTTNTGGLNPAGKGISLLCSTTHLSSTFPPFLKTNHNPFGCCEPLRGTVKESRFPLPSRALGFRYVIVQTLRTLQTVNFHLTYAPKLNNAEHKGFTKFDGAEFLRYR